MTIASWCVLAAVALIYLCTGLAKGGGRMTPRANNAPREWLDKLQGWPKRAHWAQQNGFEIFPIFAAAVITAQMCHATQTRVDTLAEWFIGCRVLYILMYLGNVAMLRSLFWVAGMVCCVWLFLLGA
jgi:uncharacterized MAPEG superfamily protein